MPLYVLLCVAALYVVLFGVAAYGVKRGWWK